jgi:hypothetical protein
VSDKPKDDLSTHHAYLFAMKERDPESYKRYMERSAQELKGEMIGSTILAAHKAHQEKKRRQQERFFDFVERNRLGR